MKHIAVVLSIIAVALISFQTKADIADRGIYMRIVDDADAAIASRDFQRAEQLLVEAMTLLPEDPRNILLLSNLGMVRFYMGNDSLALVTLNEASRKAPKSVTVMLNRARVLTAMGNMKSAVDEYRRVCETDSTVADPYFYLGLVDLQNGRKDEARKNFEALRRFDPSGFNTALAWASLLVEDEKFQEAIPYFSRLIEKEPTPEYYGGRALCEIRIGDYDSASTDIGLGLKLAPEDPQLYLYRSLLNKLRYRLDDSKADARKALELGINPQKVEMLLK